MCSFKGQPIEEPAAQLGAKPTQTTGTVYNWTRADDPVSTLDKEVIVLDQIGICRFCHSEMYYGGRRGSALRIP